MFRASYLRFYKEEELEEKLNALGIALLETSITSNGFLGEIIKLVRA
jgi:hypothetical protein